MNQLESIRRRRNAQDTAEQFFCATEGLIEHSKGTDAISKQASLTFVQAAYSMFLQDRNIDLKTRAIEDGTFILFTYLESQTINDYIEPTLGMAYGQALALALLELGYHQEKASPGFSYRIANFAVVVN